MSDFCFDVDNATIDLFRLGRHSLRSRPAKSHDASLESRERSTSGANKLLQPVNRQQTIEEWLSTNSVASPPLQSSDLYASQPSLTTQQKQNGVRPSNLFLQNGASSHNAVPGSRPNGNDALKYLCISKISVRFGCLRIILTRH